MNRVMKVTIATVLCVLLVAGAAIAGNFSPKIKFTLSTTKIKGNPSINVKVEQNDGEEELKHVTLRIPKGFTLAGDAKIPNNTTLGTGEILIAAGPNCHPSGGSIPIKQQVPLPVTLKELDRTDEQSDQGIKAIWVLDVTATKINLAVTGSKTKGWTLDGDIPPNDGTCTPFTFEMTINAKAGNVPIIKNPTKPGKYVFSATFYSLDSPATVTLRQPVKIKR
jgi:hypothetical protein